MKPVGFFVSLLLLVLFSSPPASAALADACGEVVRIAAHDGATLRYSLARPAKQASGSNPPTTLILLAGGAGVLELDDGGCPQRLKGNSLVRSLPHFQKAGLVTALLDAASDVSGPDGLAGQRAAGEHAEDIGRVVADLRRRVGGPVWVVGTSRGSISAANAAARLSGISAPDGAVLTSIVTVGTAGGRKPWTAQTVFDLPLEKIRLPILLVGHADDLCLRTPADDIEKVAARVSSPRRQSVVVTGGAGGRGLSGVDACEGMSPHGFVGQEAEVAAGIARFVGGAPY